LSSSTLKWPELETVLRALHEWLARVTRHHQEILRIGYFGSYAKGNWGVGSGLDLVIIVKSSAQPFGMRAIEFDIIQFPVPVDLLVYTKKEWQKLSNQGRWQQAIERVVWVYPGE